MFYSNYTKLLFYITVFSSFDTENGLWQSRQSMPTPAYRYSAVEFDGKIYVAGENLFNCYDPDADLWSVKTSITGGKLSLAKSKELLYAIESNWIVHKYDANEDKWTTVKKMN